MKTITTRTHIGSDGKLHLDLQTGLPAGPVEVVVVLESSPGLPAKAASLSGLFAAPEPLEEEVMDYIRQLRRETTEASWELTE
ncbi:MAG: hypothetical protein J5I93_24820 [Pirellulaceae bacterium]|nr:hypothetical protein [Pirellulaceae bacterium]